jgi:hypothetical protein
MQRCLLFIWLYIYLYVHHVLIDIRCVGYIQHGEREREKRLENKKKRREGVIRNPPGGWAGLCSWKHPTIPVLISPSLFLPAVSYREGIALALRCDSSYIRVMCRAATVRLHMQGLYYRTQTMSESTFWAGEVAGLCDGVLGAKAAKSSQSKEFQRLMKRGSRLDASWRLDSRRWV